MQRVDEMKLDDRKLDGTEPGVIRPAAVVIGASAGGISALKQILPALPAATRLPVVVVVHIPSTNRSLLPAVFERTCLLRVREPYDKEPVDRGIWFAPAAYHLLIDDGPSFALSTDACVNHSRPSIDVLFESAADWYGPDLVAVVLTGASADGARGAEAVRACGGTVVVQEPSSAEVPLMPEAARARAAPQLVAPLAEIAHYLRDLAESRIS